MRGAARVAFIAVLIFALVGLALSGSAQLVNVFAMGEAGYYCIKIPSLLVTSNGTLLAFGEARKSTCSDYAWTDIVTKRSLGKRSS
jgi:hypothetical protein